MIKREEVREYKSIENKDIERILDFINTMKTNEVSIEGFSFVGSGENSKVYRFKNFAIKIFKKPDISYNKDEKILSMLLEVDSIPDIYIATDYFVVMDYIEGKTLIQCNSDDFSFCNNSTIKKFFNDIKKCITLSVEPNDLHDANVIITKDGTLKIIDVGFFQIGKIDNLLDIILSFNTEEELNDWVSDEYIHFSTLKHITNIKNDIRKRKIKKIA